MYSLYTHTHTHRPGPPTTPLSAGAILPSTNPTDVLDMPVDPNEPTYCLCHQVSFGEMIGCDNADVSAIYNRGVCYNHRGCMFMLLCGF